MLSVTLAAAARKQQSKVFRAIACALLISQNHAFSTAATKKSTFLTSNKHQQNHHFPTIAAVSTSRIFASSMSSKAGVASPTELQEFVSKAGDRLVVIDTRNPDADVEPGDQKSLAVAGLPDGSNRPKAVHLIYDRTTDKLPELPQSLLDDKDTPIITHCGGGGRGQKAKDYLENMGFTNVMNGGGPKEKECWQVYGDK